MLDENVVYAGELRMLEKKKWRNSLFESIRSHEMTATLLKNGRILFLLSQI